MREIDVEVGVGVSGQHLVLGPEDADRLLHVPLARSATFGARGGLQGKVSQEVDELRRLAAVHRDLRPELPEALEQALLLLGRAVLVDGEHERVRLPADVGRVRLQEEGLHELAEECWGDLAEDLLHQDGALGFFLELAFAPGVVAFVVRVLGLAAVATVFARGGG